MQRPETVQRQVCAGHAPSSLAPAHSLIAPAHSLPMAVGSSWHGKCRTCPCDGIYRVMARSVLIKNVSGNSNCCNLQIIQHGRMREQHVECAVSKTGTSELPP